MAPHVVGRDALLAAGDEFLARAEKGFAALLLEGEPGVGKTTVWAEVVRRAECGGFRVLTCRPAETETKYAWSAVADLLEGVPLEAIELLPGPQRRAFDAALLREEVPAPPPPRALATAVRSLLQELSIDAPLLVAIDDLHWLDPASVTVLDFAIRRLREVTCGVLLTSRLGVRSDLSPEALVPAGQLVRGEITPLGLTDIHQVVQERLGQRLGRATLGRVHAVSGGNPFFALEIAREIVRGAPLNDGSVPVPDTVRTVMSSRLRRLPAPTRDALLVAAAMSTPSTSLVEERALAPAEEDGIVRVEDDGRITFGHPLYASAVYGMASRSRRHAAHRSLAEAITDPEERARHLAVITTLPDEQVAAALEVGAIAARSRGGFGPAAELLESAAKLTPTQHLAAGQARLVAAADHHIRGGDRVRAREVLEAALATDLVGSLRADALRLLGEVSYNDDDVHEALRLFSEALEFADDPAVAAAIDMGLAYAYTQLWDLASAIPHGRRALERVDASDGNREMLAQALGFTAMFGFLAGEDIDWDKVERALALEDEGDLVPVPRRPSTIAGLVCAYVGRHDEARNHLRTAWQSAAERGDEGDLPFLGLWLSWLEVRAGELAAAAAAVDEALALAKTTGGRAMAALLLAQRAHVHAMRGEVTEAESDLSSAMDDLERFHHVISGIWITASRAVINLGRGDARAAWDVCEPAVAAIEANGIAEPIPFFFLPDAVEAMIAVGLLDRAERVIDMLDERSRALDRPWVTATTERCRALLCATRGDLVGAADAIDAALIAHGRIAAPYERARTLLVRGVLQRRARQRTRAKASFEEALDIFQAVGARLWAARTQAELDRVGIRRSPSELTPTEQAVAELIATGLSNKRVGSALSMSPKTVEANVTRIYRKLGISSRAELGAHMTSASQK